eukprot:4215747-Amphidinium_carterae.1
MEPERILSFEQEHLFGEKRFKGLQGEAKMYRCEFRICGFPGNCVCYCERLIFQILAKFNQVLCGAKWEQSLDRAATQKRSKDNPKNQKDKVYNI